MIPETDSVFAKLSRILAEMPARTLQEIIRREKSRPGELLARSESLSLFAGRLSELLPAPLHGHVRLALIEGDRAVLLTDSPVWKSRLRFHLPQVRRLIRSQLAPRVKRIDIKVEACGDSRPPQARRPRLSARGAECLHQAARTIDDEALGQALARLASRAGRGT